MTPKDTTMRRSPLAAALAAVTVAVLAACAPAGAETGPTGSGGATSEPTLTAITDEVGRQVEVEIPVQRVATAQQYPAEFVRAVGAGDRLVGVDRTTVAPEYDGYWPGVQTDTFTGETQEQLNYDAIVALDPDVLLLNSNGAYEEAATKLEPFGIKVIVATAWDPEKFVANITLLGQLFGTETQATKILDTYQKYADLLTERLKGVEPKTVYFENTEPDTTAVPGSGWDGIITAGGGKNIFGDIVFGEGEHTQGNVHQTPVDPAEVVARDPQYVIRIGVDGVTFGYVPPSRDALVKLHDELVARPGWSNLAAVKDDHVIVLNAFPLNGAAKQVGALFVAKWLHPELFEDLDPDQALREWVEVFQGAPFVPSEQYVQVGSAS